MSVIKVSVCIEGSIDEVVAGLHSALTQLERPSYPEHSYHEHREYDDHSFVTGRILGQGDALYTKNAEPIRELIRGVREGARIPVIKAIRQLIPGIGLKEAKDLMESEWPPQWA